MQYSLHNFFLTLEKYFPAFSLTMANSYFEKYSFYSNPTAAQGAAWFLEGLRALALTLSSPHLMSFVCELGFDVIWPLNISANHSTLSHILEIPDGERTD